MSKLKTTIALSLLSISTMTFSTSGVASPPLSNHDVKVARAAWSKAIHLAKERNKGNVCEANAYQSSIITPLSVATGISPFLRKEAVSNVHLVKALAGNLMYFELTGRMKTPADVDDALSQAYFESMDGGVLGPSRRFQFLPGNAVLLTTVTITDDGEFEKPVTHGTYAVEHRDGTVRVTVQIGSDTMEFRLEKDAEIQIYYLRSISGSDGDFSNDPDECSV